MKSSDRPLVAIVDDDRSVLESLVRLLERAELDVAPFASGESLLESLEALAPDCIVTDLSMPEIGGLELQRRLAERRVDCPIVFVTGYGDIRSSVQAMRAGAVDFLTKPLDRNELLQAVRRTVRLGAKAREARRRREDTLRRLASLTPRERQVFELLVIGFTNKHIASDLGICEKTVKAHRARVMRKMNVRSVAPLARIAERISAEQRCGQVR